MNDVMLCNIMATPDFQYDIIIMYPREVHNEKIFKDNLNNVIEPLKLYIKESEMLDGNRQVFKHLKFESQQNKQKAFIIEGENILKGLLDEMNKDIKPYYWMIHKDIDTFDSESNMRIKADYILALEK
jgi:hypothetical protein